MQTEKIERYVLDSILASPKLQALTACELLSFSVSGLNEEAGEVSGLLCREVYKRQLQPQDRWIDELGDVLWYLVAVTSARGLSLDQLFEHNVKKLEERYGVDRSKEEV